MESPWKGNIVDTNIIGSISTSWNCSCSNSCDQQLTPHCCSNYWTQAFGLSCSIWSCANLVLNLYPTWSARLTVWASFQYSSKEIKLLDRSYNSIIQGTVFTPTRVWSIAISVLELLCPFFCCCLSVHLGVIAKLSISWQYLRWYAPSDSNSCCNIWPLQKFVPQIPFTGAHCKCCSCTEEANLSVKHSF